MGTQRTVPESYERLDRQPREDALENGTTQPHDDDEYEKYRRRRSMRRDQGANKPPVSVIAIDSDDTPRQPAALDIISSRDGEPGGRDDSHAVHDAEDELELESQVHVVSEQFPEDRRFKMPQTPAARGVKRKSNGEAEDTMTNPRLPMNPFHGFRAVANDPLLTATQLFNATQAQTSPMNDTALLASDRPSPMFNNMLKPGQEISSPLLQPIRDDSPIKQPYLETTRQTRVAQTEEEDSIDRDMMLENHRSEIRARRRREQADDSREISAALRAGNIPRPPVVAGNAPVQVVQISSLSQDETDDSEAETILQDIPGRDDTLHETASTVSDDHDEPIDPENKENEPASVSRVPETEVRKRHPLQEIPWVPSSPIRQERQLSTINHQSLQNAIPYGPSADSHSRFGQSQGNKIIEDSQRSPHHSRQPAFTESNDLPNQASLILRSQPDIEITSGSSDNLPKPLTSSNLMFNDPRSSNMVDELSEPIQGPPVPSTAARLARFSRNVIQSSPSTADQQSQPLQEQDKPQSQAASQIQIPSESQDLHPDILQEVAKLRKPEEVETATSNEILTAQTNLVPSHSSTAPNPGSPLRKRLSKRLLESSGHRTSSGKLEDDADEPHVMTGAKTQFGSDIYDRKKPAAWEAPSASLPSSRTSGTRRLSKRKAALSDLAPESTSNSPVVFESRNTRRRTLSLQAPETDPGEPDRTSTANNDQLDSSAPKIDAESDNPEKSLVAPMRVFAYFSSQWKGYWPGSIISPLQDGKFTVKFDAMPAEKSVQADFVRILELRIGDVVKTFLVGEKRSFTVIDLKAPGKVDATSIKSLKGVDCFGHSEVVIRPIQKNGSDKDNITVSISDVYFDPKQWPDIRDTRALPFLLAKVQDRSGILTPSLRSRSPDSPFARGKVGIAEFYGQNAVSIQQTGLFRGMVLCTTGKEAERIWPQATAHGASIIKDSFEQLFVPIAKRLNANENVKKGEVAGLELKAEFKEANFTALIMTEHVRTLKVLQALALGIPCLSSQWIEHCIQQEKALDWDQYLLAAPKSNYLGELMRSRILPYAIQPSQTSLDDMLSARPRFFQDASIYIIAHSNAASYLLLLYALGAKKAVLVNNKAEAFEAIDDDHSEGAHWDWILCFANGDMPSLDGRSRRGQGASSGDLDRWTKGLEYCMEKDVRVIHKEFVAESLILGRLVAS